MSSLFRLISTQPDDPLSVTAHRILEIAHGIDNRVQIVDTLPFPWNSICLLLITMPNGLRWIGTGFFVGRRTLLTTGHCVYLHDSGGWAAQIEVVPGANGVQRPWGSCVVPTANLRSVSGWVDYRDNTNDYGAILLPPECDFGQGLGQFQPTDMDENLIMELPFTISGYPADKPAYTQWAHAAYIQRVTPSLLTYIIDTTGGQSGAPVWYMQGEVRCVVGIHASGALSGNSAVRLNTSVLDNVNYWIAEGNGFAAGS